MYKDVGNFEAKQFLVVRILLGLWMLYFFYCFLLNIGLIIELSPRYYALSAEIIWGLPLVGSVMAVMFLSGSFISFAAIGLFFMHQLAFIAFPQFKAVHDGYLALILICFILFSRGRSNSNQLGANLVYRNQWSVPLFLVVSLGYTISGSAKCFFPGWHNGWVIEYFCVGRLGEYPCSFVPTGFIGRAMLLAELAAFPLAIFSKTRIVSWSMTLVLHLFALAILDVRPVSCAMLIFQVFTFDINWIKGRPNFMD